LRASYYSAHSRGQPADAGISLVLPLESRSSVDEGGEINPIVNPTLG